MLILLRKHETELGFHACEDLRGNGVAAAVVGVGGERGPARCRLPLRPGRPATAEIYKENPLDKLVHGERDPELRRGAELPCHPAWSAVIHRVNDR